MNSTYIERKCYKCDVAIMVISHDVSERYYCHSCAMLKLGGANVKSNNAQA